MNRAFGALFMPWVALDTILALGLNRLYGLSDVSGYSKRQRRVP